MVKNGQVLIDYGALKSDVSRKWFVEEVLHADSNEIIFGLMANLLCIFDIKCWVTTTIVHSAGFFRKNFLWAKTTKYGQNWPKIGFFFYFEKFCDWFLLEM